ncbi:ATP-binding cassette glutathione S-conjugate transporter ycf1 [Coemansia sp. Benny D115]|nr:ATP-binding cassette glutathione S-conjugate transporter ycf1 [Coemansia sp. Benny D115]
MTLLQGLVDTEKKSFIVLEDQIPENNVVVDLKDCEFSWGKEKFSLKPITLTVKTGEFVTIVGRVGGGKSSFLSGLCGEMPVVGGEGRVCGKIGYVSQKPYILNETIRENVLIGAEYDEELFKKVIEASALSEDIAKFTLGDLSEIGFDGINLSGGQKVRLALARALYLQADIYIFDDLLSAVDARVERLIVDRVLSPAGIIGDKTRILVTHAEHLIPLSSRVITFTDGAVEIVDQQPSADFSASTALSSYDIEELSKGSGPLQEEDGKFTLHPELKNPEFHISQIWKFVKLSGYFTISLVLLFELINVYAIYYVENLRIELMIDNNPETIRQSMTKYLIINAALEMGRQQLQVSLLRIHGSVGQYVSRHKAITSAVLNYDIVSQSIRNSTILVIQVCSELIRTAVILYYLRKRLVSDVSTIPGEIDVKIGLTLKVFTRTANLANIGDRFNSSLEKLSRYYIYTEKLAREAPAVIEDNRPDSDWTSTGVIEFKDYSMRYNEDSDLVLKGLTFATRKHEKVGVVGRTGAGKSSLTYALMRMVESFGGQIIIDGIDISTIGLSDLRSRIAIIPQDPALFEGTIRDNLDPMNEYTDEQVMDAIDACQVAHLLDTPTEKYVEKDDDEDFDRGPWVEGVGLNKWVEYDGKNFSVGQRQLISLCRALLWRRSIVVLDEATANVDGETDGIMQEVIRKEFKDCTVLTIAHRLGTIMDSDRILVMDHGKVAEFDTPENLLADKDSQFSLLVESMKFNHRTKEDKE